MKLKCVALVVQVKSCKMCVAVFHTKVLNSDIIHGLLCSVSDKMPKSSVLSAHVKDWDTFYL